MKGLGPSQSGKLVRGEEAIASTLLLQERMKGKTRGSCKIRGIYMGFWAVKQLGYATRFFVSFWRLGAPYISHLNVDSIRARSSDPLYQPILPGGDKNNCTKKLLVQMRNWYKETTSAKRLLVLLNDWCK